VLSTSRIRFWCVDLRLPFLRRSWPALLWRRPPANWAADLAATSPLRRRRSTPGGLPSEAELSRNSGARPETRDHRSSSSSNEALTSLPDHLWSDIFSYLSMRQLKTTRMLNSFWVFQRLSVCYSRVHSAHKNPAFFSNIPTFRSSPLFLRISLKKKKCFFVAILNIAWWFWANTLRFCVGLGLGFVYHVTSCGNHRLSSSFNSMLSYYRVGVVSFTKLKKTVSMWVFFHGSVIYFVY